MLVPDSESDIDILPLDIVNIYFSNENVEKGLWAQIIKDILSIVINLCTDECQPNMILNWKMVLTRANRTGAHFCTRMAPIFRLKEPR